MPVDAHHARPVAAAGIIAHEPALVVFRALRPDRVFQLRDHRQGRELAAAAGGGADDAFWRDGVDGSGQAFEGEGVCAVAAAQRQGVAVFEADCVWDLAFEGEDLGVLVRGGG